MIVIYSGPRGRKGDRVQDGMHSVVCRQDEEMAQQLGVKTIILGEAERGVLCAFLHDEAIL